MILNKGENVKDLIFEILTREYPLKIIELTNYIRKRYGKSVTFQAVRKALLQLKEEGIVTEENNKYLIRKEWVNETKNYLDSIYEVLIGNKPSIKKADSIKEDITVFSFDSLNEMMKFWQDIISYWYDNFKKGDPNINCYQAAHAWEALLHLDKEKQTMGRLKAKGIKSYALSVGNTQLDKKLWEFYNKIGVKSYINHSSSSFDKSYYVGTYGETIVQVQYPKILVNALDKFFNKNKSLSDLDLDSLLKIVNKKVKINMTVIKNLEMAKQINNSILSQIKV
nr:hypothetical protein [Nanoarchaeum sp.]